MVRHMFIFLSCKGSNHVASIIFMIKVIVVLKLEANNVTELQKQLKSVPTLCNRIDVTNTINM